jgi:hypothetical protein
MELLWWGKLLLGENLLCSWAAHSRKQQRLQRAVLAAVLVVQWQQHKQLLQKQQPSQLQLAVVQQERLAW